nr:glycosyltransferase family 4 protein [Acidimicrobiia bacterium]
MRIGMLAPISHPFPPDGYGPWERVCHDLTEGLVELGHEVIVYAPAGSSTSAELRPTVPAPLSDAPADAHPDARVWEEWHVATAVDDAARSGLDVLHSHLHVHALGYAPFLPMPLVSTLHGSAWHRPHHVMLRAFRREPFVSLSDAEREFLPELNYVATVHNGIRTEAFPLGPGGERLVFVGRMAPEKAPDLAVEVARRAGRDLLLVGGVEPKYAEWFGHEVEPKLGGGIEYAGPVDRSEVAALVGRSAALLMPLRWDEPFGLVVVESLAVGTPVVAWRRGAMPELIDDGVTGFLVDGVDEAVAAVGRVGGLDRSTCRRAAERRFSYRDMAAGYVAAYRRAIEGFPAERRR